MSYIGKQVSSVTTRPPQNRLSSSLKKYVHVPRVVHVCTFFGTSLYFSLLLCMLFLLNAEGKQAKSVQFFDTFRRKKHFVRFFW